METIYVFKYIPSSIKKQILYFIGQGSRSSSLIKEEYNKLYQANQDIIIDRSMGFMGFKCMIQKFLIRKTYRELCSQYIIDMREYWLMPQHMYEIDGAKIHYYYNYSNEYRNNNPHYGYSLDISLLSDEITFQRLFRCKILKLISEEL
jgi:hypothetical protein